MEKLSSGYRINRAADDAAGLAISEKMRGQIGGLAQAQRNAQDGISLVQTAEGALTEVHSMLQRVRDLKVQFENGTLSTDDQDAIAAEVCQIGDGDQEHRRPDTKFNGNALLRRGATFTFQVGANDTRDDRDHGGRTLSAAIGTAGTGGLAELTGLTSAARPRRLSTPAAARRPRRRSTTRSRTSRPRAPTSARCRTVSSTV